MSNKKNRGVVKPANNGLNQDNRNSETRGVVLQPRLNSQEWPEWKNHGKNFIQPKNSTAQEEDLFSLKMKADKMQEELNLLKKQIERLEDKYKESKASE